MADLTPAEIAAALPLAQKLSKAMADATKSAQLLYAATKDTTKANEGQFAILKSSLKSYKDEFAVLKTIKDMSKEIYDIERQKLLTLINVDTKLKEQEALYSNINRLNEKSRALQDKEIEVMKKKGQMARAYFSEVALNAKRSFQTESGHTTGTSLAQGGANTAVGIHGAADNPASMLTALGPWGAIAKIILDVIDGARILTAGLQTASAEAGDFTTSFAQSAKDANNIMYQQADLMHSYGMTTEEVSNIYKDLRNTGIAALGVIPKAGSAMSELALDTMSFAKATNQTNAQVSAQMAALTRTNGIAKQKLGDSYNEIYTMADKMAKSNVASMSETVQAAFSMNEEFKDIGMNIGGISQIIGGVGDALTKLGRPGGIDMLKKVSEGILSLSKASEGWQVLMGKMSGKTGGFLQTLFSAQQRGADMMNPKSNAYDPMRSIEMFKNTIAKTAGKSSDPRMRQYLTEKMGAQMGMDSSTVQVLQQMMSGKISQGKAKSDMEKLHAAAIENNMSSKGMFDILRNILIGMIAKPIIGIWKWLSKGKDANANRMSAAINKAESQTSKSEGMTGRNEVGVMGNSIYNDTNRGAGIRASAPASQLSPTAAGINKKMDVNHLHTLVVKDENGRIIKKIALTGKKSGVL